MRLAAIPAFARLLRAADQATVSQAGLASRKAASPLAMVM